MNHPKLIQQKILSKLDAVSLVKLWQSEGQVVVFSNGCFDIIHPGHSDYLSRAAALGNKLVLGLNSDDSVRRLKGENRPIIPQEDRARLLASFQFVDIVVIFDEDTPAKLIDSIVPDVLVKGKDYEIEDIVGASTVLQNGGRVETIELTHGFSTTELIRKIKGL
ncbi:MAG: D-glycero-beta-D-manno-heptose 1-phosphate adenylyltransferase [Bacteroidales bacterium]|nr:D-glycero-beta-D-manno-heptose 1-phosphate adenylyltransferase [Bacteroidales bacterium]